MSYSIVRSMRGVLEHYTQSEFARQNEEALRELRAAFGADPLRYRGIDRDPLRPLTASQLPLVRPDHYEARLRMGQLCDEDDLLPTEESAREVFGLLTSPDEFEIIGHAGGGIPLGYDIGDRGGDHFSVIADIAVTPRWHPPHPDDFPDIAARLRELNENLLFASPDAARGFLSYYRSCDWAETGDFAILAVSSIP